MRYSLDVAPLGELADPVAIVRLAKAAEAAGWDGVSTWDSMGVSMGSAAPDPFVTLAGVAMATERIAVIASVITLPRRRPWFVAQAAGTLDRLAGGRLVLGVGAGADAGDWEPFGEPFDAGRIAVMDESVALVDAWLRGVAVTHDGPKYRVSGVTVGPRPVREPRPPIWMGANRPGGIRRAARWDGWIADSVGEIGVSKALTPEGLADGIAIVRVERAAAGLADAPFEVAVFGQEGLGSFPPAEYEAAGATWWLESVSPMRGPLDDLLAVVKAGPPRR